MALLEAFDLLGDTDYWQDRRLLDLRSMLQRTRAHERERHRRLRLPRGHRQIGELSIGPSTVLQLNTGVVTGTSLPVGSDPVGSDLMQEGDFSVAIGFTGHTAASDAMDIIRLPDGAAVGLL